MHLPLRFVFLSLGLICVARSAECPAVNPVTTFKPPFDTVVGMHWNGRIGVAFVIDTTGVPTQLKIVQSLCSQQTRTQNQSHDCLGADKLVLEYIARWRFQPATKCNEPIEFPATVYTDLNSHH
jgi:hypothetical protein